MIFYCKNSFKLIKYITKITTTYWHNYKTMIFYPKLNYIKKLMNNKFKYKINKIKFIYLRTN